MREYNMDYYEYLINHRYFEETWREANLIQYQICDPFGTGILNRIILGKGLEVSLNRDYTAEGTLIMDEFLRENMVEITYCLEGKGSMQVYPADKEIHIKKGELIFFRQQDDSINCKLSIENYSGISIIFDYQELNKIFNHHQDGITGLKQWKEALDEIFKGSSFHTVAVSPYLQHSFAQLAKLQHHHTHVFNYLAWQGKILQLISESMNLALKPESLTSPLKEEDLRQLYQAREVLLNNMENPPSLKGLAQCCNLNSYKLKVGFKQIFHNTVYGYLREARMHRGKGLLVQTELTVGEIASRVGYDNPSQFSKAFREHFGVTPLQYRKGAKFYKNT